MNTVSQPTTVHRPFPNERYILAQLGSDVLACGASFVTEIMVIDRITIQPLPFYSSVVLGLIHHQGQLVPLISLADILGITLTTMRDRLTAIRLGPAAGERAGIAAVVDQVLGSVMGEQLRIVEPGQQSQGHLRGSGEATWILQVDVIPASIWQPQSWCPSQLASG